MVNPTRGLSEREISASDGINRDIRYSIRDPGFVPVALRAKTNSSIDLDDYFIGPRDISHHSKWPYFFRLHGSVLPRMILPLLFTGGWASAITCFSKFVHDLEINAVLLTVLGFVLGLALSFRSFTAYERYGEGRKYWSTLILTSRNLARVIWVHSKERYDEDQELGKADLLAKLTALNLISAFAVALKHRLRFEPSTEYADLEPLIGHLQILAGLSDQATLHPQKKTPWKHAGEYLGVSFAESNPRKIVKHAKENLGNIPLEILTYLSTYLDYTFTTGQLSKYRTLTMINVDAMGEVLANTERILNTPLPIAYSISISQITWVYVLMLPFQLFKKLGWITIPGTMFAAYIILGIASIGAEIENPFGQDVNDLPLEAFCSEIASDIDVLTSSPVPDLDDFLRSSGNKILYPLSMSGYTSWQKRSVDDIRRALRMKAVLNKNAWQQQIPAQPQEQEQSRAVTAGRRQSEKAKTRTKTITEEADETEIV